jgi:hypothetical protein
MMNETEIKLYNGFIFQNRFMLPAGRNSDRRRGKRERV